MATIKQKESTKLFLEVETGVAADGSATYSRRTIQHVNPALSDDNAYDLAAAIGALQVYPVNGVSRQDTVTLVRE